MAYHDSLFQLGMDLTRSSTAQKEDHAQSARVVDRARSVQQCPVESLSASQPNTERTRLRSADQHLIIDLLDAGRLDDAGHIERTLRECGDAAGADLQHVHLHQIAPTGEVAGVAVLTDSRVSVHTWPESGHAAFDIYAGPGANADAMIAVLKAAFSAGNVVVKTRERAVQPAAAAWRPEVVQKKAPARVRKARAA